MVIDKVSFKEKIGDQIEISFIGDILSFVFLTSEIDLELAKKGVLRRKEIQNKTDYKLIISLPKLSKIPKEVRDYLSTDEATDGIIAGAMITKTPLANVIINFFLGVNPNLRKKVRTKVFSNEEKALKWLQDI